MKIIKTSDIEYQHIFALIVGNFGSGKTTLAKTLKPGNKTLILSAESGLLSLKDYDIDVVIIKSLDDLYEAFNFLQTANDYKNVFFDSLTEISEQIFASLKALPEYKNNGFAIYGDYSAKIVALLKAFRDMNKYNIYMTALEKTVTENYQDTIAIDMVQKSLSRKVPALFDLVLHLKVLPNSEGDLTRVLCCDQTTSPLAKDRSGKLLSYEQPDLQAINDKIFGTK